MKKERIDAASRDATDTANLTIGSGALSSVGDVFGQSFGERTAVVVTELMEEIEKQGRALAR